MDLSKLQTKVNIKPFSSKHENVRKGKCLQRLFLNWKASSHFYSSYWQKEKSQSREPRASSKDISKSSECKKNLCVTLHAGGSQES